MPSSYSHYDHLTAFPFPRHPIRAKPNLEMAFPFAGEHDEHTECVEKMDN